MRTTLNLDDDVIRVARNLAAAEGKSLGQVISELVRKGLQPRQQERAQSKSFPVFEVSNSASPLTLDQVKLAMDDEI